jgi:hypothetical protein
MASRVKGIIQTEGFQNRVLRRISGPTRDEVTGGRKKLHLVEVLDSYSSPNIIGIMRSRRTN